jgi:hypothetical protein
LFDGKALYWGDFGLYFIPLTRFLHNQLLRGTLPLWNPWIFSGSPSIGGPQMWPFYPATALRPLMLASVFLIISCILLSFLACLFTYLWLRRGLLALSFRPGHVWRGTLYVRRSFSPRNAHKHL